MPRKKSILETFGNIALKTLSGDRKGKGKVQQAVKRAEKKKIRKPKILKKLGRVTRKLRRK